MVVATTKSYFRVGPSTTRSMSSVQTPTNLVQHTCQSEGNCFVVGSRVLFFEGGSGFQIESWSPTRTPIRHSTIKMFRYDHSSSTENQPG